MFYVFFFSSRRRHTRSLRDWSSDVCSSDLALGRSDRGDREERGEEEFHREASGEKGGGMRPPRTGSEVGRMRAREIGRASCRERVWGWVGAVSLEKKRLWRRGDAWNQQRDA